MSGEIKDGGPAFPIVETSSSGSCSPGMTLRDYFAAAALQGMLAGPDGGPSDWKRMANAAYYAADAMLAERDCKEESK